MTHDDRKNSGSVRLDSSDARKRIEVLVAGMLDRERWPSMPRAQSNHG